jgi:hypothetical protein
MAKAALVCSRDVRRTPVLERAVRTALDRIRPDNLRAGAPYVHTEPGLCLGVLNPNQVVLTAAAGVLLGHVVGDAGSWHVPGSSAPDGAYALLRGDSRAVEGVADGVASRTVWWLLTDDLFVVSTSQRAIATVAESFELDERAVAWMLSAGLMAPDCAWDRRVRSLLGGQRVRLDRHAWTVSVSRHEVEFTAAPRPGDGAEMMKRVAQAFEQTFASSEFDTARWVLPLSGGHDSRGILLSQPDPQSMQCVTWGTRDSLGDPGSDAAVATELARLVGAPHHFVALDEDRPPAETLVDRFLVNTEGRIDRLGGYADGFRLWADLAADGWGGVIRGDHPFCKEPVHRCRPCRRPRDARPLGDLWQRDPGSTGLLRTWGMVRLRDYEDLPSALVADLGPQEWPERLWRRKDEDLAVWRDRLYLELNTIDLAALTDAKAAYVEVANPLLSEAFVGCALAFMGMRPTQHAYYHKVVEAKGPPLRFATRWSIMNQAEILGRPDMVTLMRDVLTDRDTRRLLPVRLVDEVGRNLSVTMPKKGGKAGGLALLRARRRLSRLVGAALGGGTGRTLVDYNVWGFRCVLAVRMCALLAEDAIAVRD